MILAKEREEAANIVECQGSFCEKSIPDEASRFHPIRFYEFSILLEARCNGTEDEKMISDGIRSEGGNRSLTRSNV